MAFQFAYTLDGDNIVQIKDYPLDTVTNYQNSTGTNGYKKGDLVALDASGLIQRVGTASTKALGVLQGIEFTGLVAQGQPMAATNANAGFVPNAINTTNNPNGVGKISIANEVVYKVPLKSGQTATNANRGQQYGVAVSATGDQTVDLTNSTGKVVTVIDYTSDGSSVFVVMATNPAQL